MEGDPMLVDTRTNEQKTLAPVHPESSVTPTPMETSVAASAMMEQPAEESKEEAPLIGEIQGTKELSRKAPRAAENSPTAPESKPEPFVQQSTTPALIDETAAVAGPSQRQEKPPPMDAQTYAPLDRPLNVTDALSYLDAVKVQFSDQPNVYNHFLDIMKEFKNEQIDTPGVIKRVSHLFNGHPSLIQGFNTFLPAGYRIECTVDAYDAGFITVTTPGGTQMRTTNNGLGNGPITWSTTQKNTISILYEPPVRSGPGVAAELNIYPSSLNPSDPQTFITSGQAIEPAVQYVQKIKQRCDPETYRQFLDILSQYHSKPDTIDEEEVSKQVARLFKDAPDLRSDFRIFMPERSQSNLDDPLVVGPTGEGRTRTGTPSADAKGKRKLDSLANASNVGSGLPQKRKRKTAEKERERETQFRSGVAATANKKSENMFGQDLTPMSYAQHNSAQSPPHRSMQLPASRMAHSSDEHQFFDNVKRVLDNKETYNEFLKIVNLFTQDLIDTARLVREARNFLGESELMKRFQNILGWNEKKEQETFEAETHSYSWTRPSIMGLASRPSRAELNIQYGSYRQLPASEVNVTCTGRDEMCRSVLNDEWVSHPTWSSEDSGFVAHKKNIYEEALHRSEEERHEYDFHIDAVSRTIALLEPFHNRILQLSPEDRGGFKLKPGLGGTWKPIQTRIVKKIYGREAGLEVINMIQGAPAVVIPVLLQRLKQKEEEWKRAQREWNKVWREVDARNYTKSLDHKGIYFRLVDKKALTVKALVNQIEAAREEQMAKRASLIDPLFSRTRPRHQLEFVIDDVTVLQDVLKLTFSFLDRIQAQITFVERRRIEGFLRSFVPLFFMLDPVAFNSCFTVVQETFDSDVSEDLGSVIDDAEVSSVGSGSSRRNHRRGGNLSSGGDLRKKLLKSEQAKSTNRKTRAQEAASPVISRLTSPVPVEEDARPDTLPPNRKLSRKNIFFSNTVFYALLRLIEVLYSRLSLFKDIGARLVAAGPSRSNPTAVELGLSPVNDVTTLGDRATTAEHYYDLLLESLERLFDNEFEQHVFEDQMRFMFGTKEAYKSFTIDKLIGAIIKQVQAVFLDLKSQDLLEVLKKERSLVSPTTQDQINNRRNAEKVLGPDENLFRIDWLPETRTMTIQLIGKDDSSFDDSEALTGRWQSYIDSYISSEVTEGVTSSKIKSPFLRRNLPTRVLSVQPNTLSQDSLEIKICVRTYRLFFVSATEDFLWRLPTREEGKKARQQLRIRENLRRKWFESIGKQT